MAFIKRGGQIYPRPGTGLMSQSPSAPRLQEDPRYKAPEQTAPSNAPVFYDPLRNPQFIYPPAGTKVPKEQMDKLPWKTPYDLFNQMVYNRQFNITNNVTPGTEAWRYQLENIAQEFGKPVREARAQWNDFQAQRSADDTELRQARFIANADAEDRNQAAQREAQAWAEQEFARQEKLAEARKAQELELAQMRAKVAEQQRIEAERVARMTPTQDPKTGLYTIAPGQTDELNKPGAEGAFDPKTGDILDRKEMLARSNQVQQAASVAEEQQRRRDDAKFMQTPYGASMRFGGVTNVTPQGAVVSPMFTASNALGLSEAQDAERTNKIKDQWQTNMARPRTMQGAQRRQREIEGDKMARERAEQRERMNQAQIAGNLEIEKNKGITGIGLEMAKQGVDPVTRQPFPARQQPIPLQPKPVKTEEGLWVDENTGKPLPEAAGKRLDAAESAKVKIEKARKLDPTAEKDPNWFTRMFGADPDKWGYDTQTGEFKVVDEGEFNKKNSRYLPLTPEERAAMMEAAQGKRTPAPATAAPAPAAGQPGTGINSATPAPASAAPTAQGKPPVMTPEQVAQAPIGTVFTDSAGNVRRKTR
jgi:hypothetical protein